MIEDPVYDFGGLKFRVLFNKYGYAPHYAEHVIDPLDGKPKLVMADPHLRNSVYIYDLVDKKIEWEFKVPGSRVPNPHIAHMITDENPLIGPFWSRVVEELNKKEKGLNVNFGDIVCAAGKNNLIIIDRKTKSYKKLISIPGSQWLHDIVPSVNGDGFIISDHRSGWVRKIDFNGNTIWEYRLKQACKISIAYTVSTTHMNKFEKKAFSEGSYIGSYIVTSNSNIHGVYELDDNGELLWSCPCDPQKEPETTCTCRSATWLYHPHSAFRMGLAEYNGNLTIIGLEGGGGIIAVDYECRPRWGIMKPHTHLLSDLNEECISNLNEKCKEKLYKGKRELYRPTYHGFFQTTHVFPLLNGGIGAVDWRGKYSSQVVEIVGFPTKTALYWLLAWDYPLPASQKFTVFEPAVEIGEWDTIGIQVINNGGGTVEYEILCSLTPIADSMDFFHRIHSNKIKPNATDLFVIDRNIYTALLFRARSLDKESKITVFVTQKRI